MKTKNTIMVLSIIAVASVISVGAFGSSTTALALGNANGASDGLVLQGHLEMIKTDSQGNIEVVEEGANCLLQQAFRTDFFGAGSSSNCAGDPGVFNVIYIGDDATAFSAANTTATAAAITNATQMNINPQADSDGVVLTDHVGGGAGANAVLSVTFQNVGGSLETIDQAAILNGTDASASKALAYREFNGIPLDDQDQLTINWTVEITAN
jgi:hypothetical protein